MLEARQDQGAGLHQITPHSASSLLAVVSHGDRAAEMAMLWQLCSTIEGFGYAVAVLDASTPESHDNPGLQDMLDNGYAFDAARANEDSWTVLPAARGLQSLAGACSLQGGALPLLGHLLSAFGAVIIYADAATLGRIMPGSDIRPLLAVSPVMTLLISAYRSVKQLVTQAQITPLVATVAADNSPTALEMAHNVNRSLLYCTRTHLGQEVESMIVRAAPHVGGDSPDARRLALRLLEGAVALAAPPPPLSLGHQVRSH